MDYQLEIERASVMYDPETRVIHVTYRGELDGDTNAAVYEWLEQLYQEIGIETVWGQVFDFREVSEFQQENLKTARRTSTRMNMRTDVSSCPAALIVSDFYHEEILRGSMRVVAENVRKKIVWSEDEALQFLEEWHAQNEPE